MSQQFDAPMMINNCLRGHAIVLALLLTTLFSSTISVSSESDNSATHRPRTLLHPFAKFRGQEVNYAPVVVVEGASSNKDAPAEQPVEPQKAPPKPAEDAAAGASPSPKQVSPFKTTYSASKSDTPTIMPKVVAAEPTLPEARANVESQQLDQIAKEHLKQTMSNKDAKQDSRVVKAWGLGLGRR